MGCRIFILIAVVLTVLISPGKLYSQTSQNPPAKGFNLQGSDQKAIEIADKVMTALGGRKNWDKTRCITWNYFGRRRHIWDKWSGDVRLEDDNLIVLMNLNTRKGRAWDKGVEIMQPDSLQKILDNAYAKWINDSYWLIMPYKLKDSGVTLKYKGEGLTADGKPVDILQLTFEDVGLTPQNKYLVYVDKKSHLVTQWEYFRNADDAEPAMQTTWNDWKQFGDILLSGNRDDQKITDIAVFDEMPEKLFESPESVNIDELIKKK